MNPTRRHELRIALGLAAGLALAMAVPGFVHCAVDAPEPSECLHLVSGGSLGNFLMLLSMMACTALLHPWLPPGRGRGLGLALLVLAAAAVGMGLAWLAHHVDPKLAPGPGPYLIQVMLTLAACLVTAHEATQRARAEGARTRALNQQAQQQERDLATARLQLLQAQVEPHFLFNTLAHLRRLAQTDPQGARAMLADLLHYLGEALPSLRDSESTLGRELGLVRAYLALHQLRMGSERLRLHFDVPEALHATPLPSTSLLSLAENAIKHGIAPQVGGGEITVRAWREGEQLVLELADTGRGMSAASGHGTGLATLRARLKAMYGEAASLSLLMNQPRGLIARLSLPL